MIMIFYIYEFLSKIFWCW